MWFFSLRLVFKQFVFYMLLSRFTRRSANIFTTILLILVFRIKSVKSKFFSNLMQESKNYLLQQTSNAVKASVLNYTYRQLCNSTIVFLITSVHDSLKKLFIYDLYKINIAFKATLKLKIKRVEFVDRASQITGPPWSIHRLRNVWLKYSLTLLLNTRESHYAWFTLPSFH